MPKKSKSKNKIIRTSFALFLEKGYKDVTIINIMEATNLSKGAIYHYFKSKEEIYFATLETYYFNMLRTEEYQESTGDFKTDVTRLYTFAADLFDNIENITEEGLDYPIRNFFSFQLESEKNEWVRINIQEAVHDYRTMVKNLVLTGIKNNQVRKDLDANTISLRIISILEGLAIHYSTTKRNVKKTLLPIYKAIFTDFLETTCTY